ncbi:MAG: DUF5818 domain-containing protein [Myxococcales bacterium]|nr:DUF5818 domain-containing protein [Myxococcales bacterium]
MSTRKLTGRIGYVDLEGGYYTLTTEGGEVYKLDGGGPDLRVPGVQVQVEGSVDEAGFGIGFGTPVLQVKKYQIK